MYARKREQAGSYSILGTVAPNVVFNPQKIVSNVGIEHLAITAKGEYRWFHPAVIVHGPGFNPTELARELEEPMNPDNRFVAYRQLAEFTIESDQKLHCNLDGEPVAKKTLRFSVLPGRIKMAC